MSYEGSVQIICKNGHYSVEGYDYGCGYPSCGVCGEDISSASTNDIDETNGCYRLSDGTCACGMRELILKDAGKSEICNLGHAHVTKEPTYSGFGNVVKFSSHKEI